MGLKWPSVELHAAEPGILDLLLGHEGGVREESAELDAEQLLVDLTEEAPQRMSLELAAGLGSAEYLQMAVKWR